MTAQHRRPSRHWQLVAAGLAAVTIGALATVSSGTSADAAAPHAGTRAQVPWSRVGTGWSLATWAKSADKGRPTLFLLAPDGHRYTIASLATHEFLKDWSPDGRRVLVGGDNHLREVDLHTGRGHVIKLPEEAYVTSYTRPKGHAVLVDLNARLQRFDLEGHHQKTYPATVRGAGRVDSGGALETADGTQLVVSAGKGLVVLRNNGSVVRRLMPKSHQCFATSFETAKSLQVSCSGRIWSVPLSGARAHPLTKGPNKSNEFGYYSSWRYSRGTLGLAEVGCGPLRLVRFDKAGNGHRVTVTLPSGKAARVAPVGHHGDIVNFLARPGQQNCMADKESLIAYNAVTHHSRTLLGPGVNGGTVLDVLECPTR